MDLCDLSLVHSIYVQPDESRCPLLSSRGSIQEVDYEVLPFELPTFTISGRVNTLSLERIFARQDLFVGLVAEAKMMTAHQFRAFVTEYRKELIEKLNFLAESVAHCVQLCAISFVPEAEDESSVYVLSAFDKKSAFYTYSRSLGMLKNKRLVLLSPVDTNSSSKIVVAFPIFSGNLQEISTECSYIDALQSLGIPSLMSMQPIVYRMNASALTPAFLMEYCTMGPLADLRVARCIENEKNELCEKIIRAIAIMHANHQTHQDLCCDNIFLTRRHDQVRVRLVNFASCLKQRGKYVPPELVSSDISINQYAVDIWQLGDVLFYLRFGYSLCKQYLDYPSLTLETYHKMYKHAEQVCLSSNAPFDRYLLTLFSLDPSKRLMAGEVMVKIQEHIVYSSLSIGLMQSEEEDIGGICSCL